MDNLSRGLHSHAGAGVKTGLAVCLIVVKHQSELYMIGTFLGQVANTL
jgi:hypothetical protein